MTREKNDTEPRTSAFETTSERYGNGNTIEDVFEKTTRPLPSELVDALANTTHLTEKEATAFTQGQLGTISSLPAEIDTDKLVRQRGFEDTDDFNAHKNSAREKIADAIWITELIDAYRLPDFPDECPECGTALGGRWVEDPGEDEIQFLCIDCADADVEQLQ